jgi:hydrophobic/amphiphilic exporter-1 (mainly G- bacteria), HAE1 family
VGTTVFGGMIASTFLNLIFIPVLYVLVRRLQSGFKREAHAAAPAPSAGD